MMEDFQAHGRGRNVAAVARGAVAALLSLAVLAGCTAVNDMTRSPEQAAAEQPARVTAQGQQDEFPNLGEVPAGPRPYTAPEVREDIVEQMAEDRSRASFTTPQAMAGQGATGQGATGQGATGQGATEAPAPLTTAAGPDPFASSTIISSDSVTTSDQVAGLPAAASAGAGQLTAIIFFGHGSAGLDAEDRRVLRDLASLHGQRGGGLRVVGHSSSRTQNTTPDDHQITNFEMSLARANAVRQALVDLGVAPEVIRTEAVGDAEPVYHEFMPSGEAGNRRVEIFLEN